MGKSRRNRSGPAGRRPDPMSGGGPRAPKAVKEPSDPALAALRTAKILPVLGDLRSANPATRTAAAGAIANIVEDARCRKLLLREQVVHLVLSETLADASVESRAAGWAVLNVLAQHEAADFCVHLYRSDVLTPAAHALGQIRTTLEQGSSSQQTDSKLTKAQQDFMWRITSAIIDLLGQLADARDEILAAVAKEATITRALFALATGDASIHISTAKAKAASGAASTTAVPFEIQWSALITLARLCDDVSQRALAETLVDDQASGGCYGALRRLQAAGGPLAVAAASLLHSVFATLEWYDHSPGREGASDAVLVPTLARVIEQQLDREEKEGAASGEKEVKDADEEDRSAEVLGLSLQTLALIGTTLKASLEKGNKDEAVWNGIQDGEAGEGGAADDSILFEENGGHGGGGDDDEEMADGDDSKAVGADDSMDVDGEEDDDDDSDNGIDIDRDMEHVTGADDEDGENGNGDGEGLEDLTILRSLISDAIPQIIRLVAARAQDAASDSVSVLLDALSALNNIAWTVSLVDLRDDGNAAIRSAWRPVARRIWLRVVRPLLGLTATSAEASVELHVAAQVAGLAWALSRVLAGTTPTDAGEPARFMALREAAATNGETNADAEVEEDPFSRLPVKCIGVLGQMALDPAPAALNREISKYLLGLVNAADRRAAPAEIVEALNQLFDIYGDETADCDREVFWHDKLLTAFEAALPKTKAMAKAIDKRLNTELRTRADEAVLNLGRFIQYKKKHAPAE
ncbi:armadillo repeat protein [Sporothrix schenckii 1099-18]|uniref:SYO1-like TPR repeats domain-containing protein n=2 Tax=Sporothrix schenckii TaxID=29908 RepID=U7PYC4_SPOS1|nr:armadillo repeat protein [Sporothrix schenckii 1099-18]ERS99916.1 hypothetical protein HMPREF1624_03284 [Sporothrix schenckii ATCC 58251]KJR85683.1 armadillo repeat protein [Sporothrix schenckii 1099-18]